METQQFKIEYRLTLKDGSFLETITYVAASDVYLAATKLKLWRKTQKPKFDEIEFLAVDRSYNIII